MAEITIKIFDTLTGGIDLEAKFEPEYKEGVKTTPAQNFAGHVLKEIAVLAEQVRKYYAETEDKVASSETNEEAQGQEEVPET